MTSAAIYGCAGHRLTEDERAFFAEARPWGFILFRRNIDTPEQVRALTERFRRAGREFTREPVTIPRDELSDAELKQLLDEPLLAVEIVAGEV